MKRIRWTLLLVLAATFWGGQNASPARASDTNGAKGKTTTYRLMTTLVRPWKGKDGKREVTVYTPAGYDDPVNVERHYPVIFLLHGSPGNAFNYFKFGDFGNRMEAAVRAQSMQPVIFVIPDGNYVGQKEGDSEWADSADRRDRFESWVVKELVPWTDSHFRTRPDASSRFLGGVSEGGFGSVNLALRNPRVFGGAVGLSGYYDMRGFGWGHIIMNDSDAEMSFNSPLFYVPDKTTSGRVPPEWKRLKIFVGAGANEKPYADHTRRIGDALKAAGVRTVIVRTPEGKHDWNLWSGMFFEAMHDFLPAM